MQRTAIVAALDFFFRGFGLGHRDFRRHAGVGIESRPEPCAAIEVKFGQLHRRKIFSRARPAASDTAPNRRSFPGDTRAGGRGAAAPRCRAFECRFAVLRKGGCRTVREWSGCAHRLRLVPRATASAGWEPARLRRKWWRPEWKQPRQALAL